MTGDIGIVTVLVMLVVPATFAIHEGRHEYGRALIHAAVAIVAIWAGAQALGWLGSHVEVIWK